MKKWISLILVVTIMSTVCMPVYAGITNMENLNFKTALYNGHGEFQITSSTFQTLGSLRNNVSTMNIGDSIRVYSTEDEEIYKVDEYKYLTRVHDDKYLLTDKLNVNTEEYEINEDLFDEYNVSQKLRDEIKAVIEKQQELGNDEFSIDVFAPSKQQMVSDVNVMADEPLGYTYYTYNYRNQTFYMRDYSTKYENIRSDDYEVTGSNALNTAKSFINFIVSITSNYSVTLNAFSLGQSAYQVYSAAFGSVGSGSSRDIIRTALVYSWIHKETIARDFLGEYAGSGCSSYKAWLDHHETYQYYGATGRGQLLQPYIGEALYSEHFQNPAPTAIDWGYTGYVDDFLYTTIHGRRLVLMGR